MPFARMCGPAPNLTSACIRAERSGPSLSAYRVIIHVCNEDYFDRHTKGPSDMVDVETDLYLLSSCIYLKTPFQMAGFTNT